MRLPIGGWLIKNGKLFIFSWTSVQHFFYNKVKSNSTVISEIRHSNIHQDIWDISADLNNFFSLLASHVFTNFSLREEEHLFIGILICTCLDHHDLTEFSFDRSIWGCPQPQCIAFCLDSVTSLVEFHIAFLID